MTSLLNIQVDEKTVSETQKEITAILIFKENPYFTNSEIRVTVKLDNDMPKSSTASQIQWKDGKNLTIKTVSKSQKNKKTGAKRQVTKEVKCKSFFGLFKDFTDKDAEESYKRRRSSRTSSCSTTPSSSSSTWFPSPWSTTSASWKWKTQKATKSSRTRMKKKTRRRVAADYLEPAKAHHKPAAGAGADGKEECKKQ